MKKIILILIMTAGLALSGCSGNDAQELFETAEFEELQHNKEHAGQLYREIIAKYPNSEYADKAEQRLSALKGQGKN
jgi:outer membrane protein assembly factor BamD (BamD/ComL family)